MTNIKRKVLPGFGQRLRQIRIQFNLSCPEMAQKLGIDLSTYHKNEQGIYFPSVRTLNLLHKDFDVSMDWLMFENGPLQFKEKAGINSLESPGGKESNLVLELESVLPDVNDFLLAMVREPLFRHKVMLQYYEYRNSKEKEPGVS